MLTRLRGVILTDICSNVKHKSLTFENIKISYHCDCIPNYNKVWIDFCSMKYTENVFKQRLLNELISECNISHPNFLTNTSGKHLLIKLDFKTLREFGLVLNPNSIASELLNHLEPFPFDNKELEKQNPNKLSVGRIRNEIEKQYLSWKFKVDQEEILWILHRFRPCLYPFRSLANLKNNIQLMESEPKIQEINVCEKIYLLNQKPFDMHTVKNFQKDVAGVVWFMLPECCIKILRHSHQYILSLVSVLQNLNFTNIQIQEGLPFLHISFGRLFYRLNNLLKRPETAKYRNEDLFLKLLFFPSTTLFRIVDVSFMDLIETVRIFKKQRKIGTNRRDLLCLISQLYEIDCSCLNIMSRHSGFRKVSEKQIYDTLCFLKENKFTSKEVAESLTIIFYPREDIAKTLEKIKEEEPKLKEIGFVNGCISINNHIFATGTKEKRKTLQLCLYYLSKSYHFSEDKIGLSGPNFKKDDVIGKKENAIVSF